MPSTKASSVETNVTEAARNPLGTIRPGVEAPPVDVGAGVGVAEGEIVAVTVTVGAGVPAVLGDPQPAKATAEMTQTLTSSWSGRTDMTIS